MKALALALLIACGSLGDGAVQSGAVSHGTVTSSAIASQPEGLSCGDPPQTSLSVWLDGRNVDGANNSTLTNNDPVTTWDDQGSIGDNPTQGTAGAKPTFIASCLNGKACVRFDGGDHLRATTASNFNFLHSSAGSTTYVVAKFTAGASTQVLIATTNNTRGVVQRLLATSAASYFMHDGVGFQVALVAANNTLHPGSWDAFTAKLENASPPGRLYVNGSSVTSGGTATFSASNAAGPLTIGATTTTANLFTGDIAQVLLYSAAHDDTTRGTVEDWIACEYGTMPVTP